MKIKLTRPFAANTAVDEYDVKQIKKALNRLGYYMPNEKAGITGITEATVFSALKKFQKDNNLAVTGATKPGDVTEESLNKEVSKTPEGQYIWRSVEDGRVRKGHAEFNRTIRDWNDSPDPGEEFNCRCWAIHIKKENCQDKEIIWINAEAKLFIAKQNLTKSADEKNLLQKSLSQKEIELEKINSIIEKEKNDKRKAQNIGAAAGATAGAILGAPRGPGGSLAGAEMGLGLGAKGGDYLEEIGDALDSKSETNISLNSKKQNILKEIKELKINIEILANKIDKILLPEVERIQLEVKQARADLESCMSQHRK